MGGRNKNRNKKTKATTRNTQGSRRSPQEKFSKRLWRKSTVWMAALLTGMAGATAGAFGSGLAQHLLNTRFAGGQLAGQPVEITYASQEPSSSGLYAFPQSLILTTSQLRKLTNLFLTSGWDNWMESKGGIDPYQTIVQIGFSGNRTYPVEIDNMKVVNRQCTQPFNGSLFYRPASTGAVAAQTVPQPSVSLDLDLTAPFARSLPGSASANSVPGSPVGSTASAASDANYFNFNSINLKMGELQKLTIFSSSSKLSCKYDLAITVSGGDKTTTEVITNDGKSFATAGGVLSASSYHILYVEKEGEYYRANPSIYRIPSIFLGSADLGS
jgi:hypothetical protein